MIALESMRWARMAAVLLAFLLPGLACAQYQLATLPAEPAGGQPFEIRIRATPCLALYDPGTRGRDVEVLGNVVRVRVRMAFVFGCIGNYYDARWELDPLPPGDYRLELIGVQFDLPSDVYLLQAIDFTVGAAAPRVIHRVPATGPVSACALLLGALLAVLLRRRGRLG